MIKQAVYVCVVAILLLYLALPPRNRVIYHYYSNSFPPSRAAKVTGLFDSVPIAFSVKTAMELGVFEFLDEKGGATANEVATASKASPRGTEILLNCLVGADFLQMDGNKYKLTGATEAHLLKRAGPDYLGGLLAIAINKQLVDGMAGLTEAVRNGGSQLPDPTDVVDHPFWTHFADSSREMSLEPGRFVASTVSGWAAHQGPMKVLDVAAGSGGYGYSFAKMYNGSTVDFLDGGDVLKTARANADSFGFTTPEQKKRFNYLPGDAFVLKIAEPETYDVILISHFYHHFNHSENIRLTKKMANLLKKDGRLVVQDFITEAKPSLWENPFPRLFSLLMLANTRQGQAFSVDDYHNFFTEAGLQAGSVVPHLYMPASVVIGIKK